MNRRIEKYLAIRNIQNYKKLYENINDSLVKTVINNKIVTIRFKKTHSNIKVTRTTFDIDNGKKFVKNEVIY